jgi:hypothetical protein
MDDRCEARADETGKYLVNEMPLEIDTDQAYIPNQNKM